MKCLDTTFLIDLLNGRKEAIKKSENLDNELELFTTEINVFEILYGIFRDKTIDDEKELQSAKKLFDKLRILPLKGEATIKSARIAGELTQKGVTIDSHDCITAGVSLANGVSIMVTKNKDHFSRIRGLGIETY
ncbi:MAG: PIN domain-containing protein [Nanoarchaeota archaeon]|nr:PIN domain-containing protein [Nanoarchaeota archaeon]MBU1005777.1 PIN domain-containing protein [Nanoarchaeota archaeon]MBU1946648.1 PIN domain-containing protein [Nanoarchaeota archaeon]